MKNIDIINAGSEATENLNYFFNYSNEEETVQKPNDETGGVLVITTSGKSCTANFGNAKNKEMQLQEIRIYKKRYNIYDGDNRGGEIILNYYQTEGDIVTRGQVCIPIKEVSEGDSRINKNSIFISDNRGDDLKLDMDKILPNGGSFYYVTSESILGNESERIINNIIIFDNYTIYTRSGFLESIGGTFNTSRTPIELEDSSFYNSSGSVRSNEKYITECHPIGADAMEEKWSEPSKNAVFSFFNGNNENQTISPAWKHFTETGPFDYGGYDDGDGTRKGFALYVFFGIFIIIIPVLIFITFIVAGASYSSTYSKGFKLGEKMGKAKSI
jgi:hypothetical protein